MTGPRVLVVDDEPQILRALRTSLRGAGYEVDTAETAEAALAAAAMRPPEAVVLDLVLPDRSGTEVARELRGWSSAPIIVLSAVGEEREKVAALDAGADDYVTKPVGIDELLARLRAVLRRTAPSGEPVIEVGELVVDLPSREVRMAGKPVHLTPHQFDLLRVLAVNAGKLLTQRQLLQEVWGPGYADAANLLQVNVSQLRRKIEPDRANPRYLLTEPGAGLSPGHARVLAFRKSSGGRPESSGGLQDRVPSVVSVGRSLRVPDHGRLLRARLRPALDAGAHLMSRRRRLRSRDLARGARVSRVRARARGEPLMAQGWGQIAFYAVVLVALSYPLGIWMARVYTRERGDAVERGFLRLLGRDAAGDQDWKQYALSVIAFTIAFSVFLYGLLRLQGHLFLNPDHLPAVPWTVALNTTASFVTNTNWQYYGGEATMSYLSQMAGLAVQNFVSAGAGMAVLAAVIRGIARRGSGNGLGNFWRDLYRSIVYILLPLSIVLAVILISQGVPQTFHGHATATTLQGAHQAIARGPAASQIAIKQLGTNGGGFYNSNSAVPFENPTPPSNFFEVLAILLIPFAQVVMFGRMVLARRHAWVLYAACFSIFAIGVGIAFPAEQHGSQVLRDSGVNIAHGAGQSAGT